LNVFGLDAATAGPDNSAETVWREFELSLLGNLDSLGKGSKNSWAIFGKRKFQLGLMVQNRGRGRAIWERWW